MLTALVLVRLVCIINWKIKIIIGGGKEGEDNIDILIRFIFAHLTVIPSKVFINDQAYQLPSFCENSEWVRSAVSLGIGTII